LLFSQQGGGLALKLSNPVAINAWQVIRWVFVFGGDFKPGNREQREAAVPSKKQNVMSNTKMYVGNLPFTITEDELRDAFSAHGAVNEVALVMDRDTGRPRGFGFVTMNDKDGMEAAIRELDGKDFGGRSLTVNEARPRENRGGGGGGGGGGGYGGGGGGGGDRRGGGGGGGGGRSNDRW
jgi:cold-inducible RNA-binding protein